MSRRRLCLLFVAAALGTGTVALPAWAEGPPNQETGAPEHPGCFGEEAAELAQSDTGAMGEHASGGFGEDLRPGPGRAGIGNVGHLFGENVQDVGFILGGGDCPR